jgi:hypothetical protein
MSADVKIACMEVHLQGQGSRLDDLAQVLTLTVLQGGGGERGRFVGDHQNVLHVWRYNLVRTRLLDDLAQVLTPTVLQGGM